MSASAHATNPPSPVWLWLLLDRRRKQSVRVTAGKATAPARLENFKIELRLPVPVGDEHRKGVEEAVHHCLIHNTLLHPPTMTIEVEGAKQAAQVA